MVDQGHPVGMSGTVTAAEIADDGGANPPSGISVVRADSIDSAVKMARGCPMLADGGSVEVAEAMTM